MTRNKSIIFLITVFFVLSACRTKKIALPRIQNQKTLPAFFDVRPTEEPISYLYAPGMMNSELGMMRYCPEFTACTGEEIACKSGGHIIGQPHSAVTFPEIDLRKPTYFTLNPLTAFINSMRQDLAPLAQRVMQDSLNFTVKDNPACPLSVVNYSFNFSKANLGQKADIETLHAAYQEHIELYGRDTNIIMLGDSRGAATIFNFIALHKPAQVKAAILDGIFDDIPHTVKHFLYTDKAKAAEARLYGCIKFFMRSYKETGISARQCAEIINDDVPLLMVISLKDGLVAPQSAFYLYSRLRLRGHQKVHILVLKKSLHPSYMVGDPEDKMVYESTVHAFYKHYNLPHNAQKAALGQQTFQETQPSIEQLHLYKLDQCPYCNTQNPIIMKQAKKRRSSAKR